MNKLMMAPLTVMIVLAVISLIMGTTATMQGSTGVADNGSMTVNGTTTNVKSSGGSTVGFNLFGTDGIIAGIIALVAIGIIAGIRVFSSGISDTSQVLIMKSVGFFGLWALLSVVCYPMIVTTEMGTYGTVMYGMMTLAYALGFMFDFKGSGISG